jgi:hypothetical protein
MTKSILESNRTDHRFPRLRSLFPVLALFVLALNGAGRVAAQQPAPAQGLLGATYKELLPEQKTLVDDWFQRVSVAMKKTIPAEEGYDNMPLSYKTTFSAITHALIHTPLTDKDGKSLGASAIILIDKVDTVAGQIPGVGGDEQFRIYIELKPGALEILEKSKEFARGPDNTIYHHGYPVCYRSSGGTPSIQVSSRKDGKQADIDVDYRSSKFPAALVNGHLTASNSDVRSGNNDERHNQHWTGMNSWWRSILGIPMVATKSGTDSSPAAEPVIKANAKPEVAVHDFLNSWLVDQRPDLATAYFATSAFSCMEIEQGTPLDYGVAKFSMLMALRQVNERVGKIAKLSDVSSGVRLSGPRGKVIPQPNESEFILYDVREDLVEQMKCANQLDPSLISAKAAQSKAFGKYVGAVFKLKAPGEEGKTIAAIWAKQENYWKLISYDVDPKFEPYHAPDATAAVAAAAIAVPPITYAAGDKDLTQAATDFHNEWFVQGKAPEAFQYLSSRAYACVNLYREENTPAPKSPAEAGQLVQTGMKATATFVGNVKKLEDAIVAPVVSHPDVQLVKHPNSKAFVLASVPDHMAAAADCQGREAGKEIYFEKPSTGNVYGNFYATGFRLSKPGGEAGVLWALWTKENGQWKVVSYFLITP